MKENPADIAARSNLELQKKHFGKTENLIVVLFAALFFFGMMLLFFILPHKEYSKTENRTLASLPAFSTETLEKGKYDHNRYAFLEGVVDYLGDHFPFRDGFMGLNGLYETATGRFGSGGVILGQDGYLLYEEFPASDAQKAQLSTYAEIIDILAENIDAVVAVAGKGSEVMVDKFPAVIDTSAVEENRALVNAAFQSENYSYLDLCALLSGRSDEEIYFRTDHHWNALGALCAASAILKQFGAVSPDEDPSLTVGTVYKKEVVLTDFKGTLYNRSGLYFLPGEELYALRCDGDDLYTVTYCDAQGEPTGVSTSLYNDEALSEEYRGTAYDYFVAPVSTPVVKIEKQGEDRETLLVVKDSFAHSVLPYLARFYNIISVDVRKNADYAYELIASGAADKLLVLVNTETLFGA